MKAISLRLMTEGDLPAADALRRCAGWNQTLEDWRRLRRWEPHGCFVALQGAEIIGTVTTTTYGPALAWIGMMLVHPDCRQRGVGTGLMHRALEYLHGRNVACVKLDATPAGRPVYEKLGFLPEWTLTRCHRPAETRTVSPECAVAPTRDLSDADWGAVGAIDQVAFGAPRSRV